MLRASFTGLVMAAKRFAARKDAWRWFCAVVFALTVRYQYKLLFLPHWVDEAETVVVARMMAAGDRLYGTIFNHHGPLVFCFGYALERLAAWDLPVHRLSMVALLWTLFWCCINTPVLEKNAARATCVLSVLYFLLGHYQDSFTTSYMYQSVAGCFVCIALTLWVLPTLYPNRHVRRRRVAIGSFLLTCLPFLAIFYGPSALLVWLSSIRRATLRPAVFGAVTALAGNLWFLAATGSFPGYVAYHLYLNLEVLPQVVGHLNPWAAVWQVFQVGQGPALAGTILAACVRLAASNPLGQLWRPTLLFVGLAALGVRGPFFHALPFIYAAVVVGSVFVSELLPRFAPALVRPTFAVVAIFVLGHLSLLDRVQRHRLEFARVRVPEAYVSLLQAFTQPSDPTLCYTFYPDCYLASGRPPASGHFFYLPAQGLYDRAPKYGVHTDNAADLQRNRPKFVRADEWDFNGRVPWRTYAAPIVAILESDYVPLGNMPAYARKDLDLAEMGLARRADVYREEVVGPAGPRQSLPLRFSARQQQRRAPMTSLDVHFVTWGRQARGKGVLRLHRAQGGDYVRTFPLDRVKDARSTRFHLPRDVYLGGELEVTEGDAIGLVQVTDAAGAASTCLGYASAGAYARWTPGCPAPLVEAEVPAAPAS